MILIINTCFGNALEIILASNKDKFQVKKAEGKKQAEMLLPEIKKLLKKNKTSLKDLKGIGVVRGPGGFTAVRIGVATANALAYGRQIPVIGVTTADFKDNSDLVKKLFIKLTAKKTSLAVLPYYDREPNITIK